MAGEWHYKHGDERRGPVSSAKLKQLAAEGWLTADDPVWQEGMPEWVPAGSVRGLFTSPLLRSLGGDAADVKPPAPRPPDRLRPQPARRRAIEIDTTHLAPRHVVAAVGGFLASLGIAFTAIARSPVALAFTLGGLALAAVGMYVEVGRLLGQAIENVGKASREAADRRQEARRLAVEKQRLDLEARRLAHEEARARRTQPASLPTSAAAPPRPLPAGTGDVVVINQPPVQRWSPGLAAVLSFLVPGLGQLYKGQILNAIAWFVCVSLGYLALILPGLVLHLFCVLGAASGNPWTPGETTIVRRSG